MLQYCSTGEQEVKSFVVRCSMHCGWKGELRLVEDHKKDCPEALIPCPRGCNNGSTKITRKNVEAHLQSKCPNRPYTCTQCEQEIEFRNKEPHLKQSCRKRRYYCPHCFEAGVYDERTTTHYEICPKVEVQCSKCCIQLLRSDQPKHHLLCQHEPVRCKYYNIGCGEKPLRKDLSKHEENAQLHLSVATEELLRLKKLTFRIKHIAFHKKQQLQSDIYGPYFNTSITGYKMCLSIDINGWSDGAGTNVSVFVHLMKGDHDDTLTWPFTGSVTFELLNQLEDKNHHKRTTAFPADDEVSKRVVDGERAGRGYGNTKLMTFPTLPSTTMLVLTLSTSRTTLAG